MFPSYVCFTVTRRIALQILMRGSSELKSQLKQLQRSSTAHLTSLKHSTHFEIHRCKMCNSHTHRAHRHQDSLIHSSNRTCFLTENKTVTRIDDSDTSDACNCQQNKKTHFYNLLARTVTRPFFDAPAEAAEV